MPRGRKRKPSVADAAVEDFKHQREAYEKRRQVIAGDDLPLTPERNPREFAWRKESLDVLCKPARFAVSFKDLPTAKQIRILSEAARDARAILYDLERSQQRKLPAGMVPLRSKDQAGQLALGARRIYPRAHRFAAKPLPRPWLSLTSFPASDPKQ
jgi:hypothetical protein